MKSFLLSLVMTISCLVAITAIFRALQIRRRATLMLCVFLISVPVFIVIHLTTPPSLGMLPPLLTVPSRWIDLGFGIFIYVAAFFGGVLQIYNLADRGFSLRMLVDISESPREMLTVDEMLSAYSQGQGLGWMYQKRLDGLLDQGMILIADGTVRNSVRGRRVASIYGWLRTFLRLQPS